MLDSVTKKRIDDLRNILVGKIPSPQLQVEQITTGLIYKFMYDMDNEAIEMGGIPSFFVDEFEQYSWKHLFNPKLGGVDKVKLYTDAIENLYSNPHAPSIFREIFKNSFLPFKDPSTLNMFLKEINEFHYSNSEQLGDAYEYLLSFMGSQGDAGQFRTPRHIIDFIIKIVNPQKNETILDPACGTSGFLISSYKHILNQNTKTRIGDQLNASERKIIGENLVGYDIDPAMSRISLVNMYLHQFANPKIEEYDTLSSEEKWNEYFDVILANPPFFSPTGGIKPHSRFGVQSTRAEVLFVDYIIEHLKPKGRAGVIVPEGIIFQTGTAYKKLRKKLIDDCLVGIISLPAGVFQPYSGVKTSILILNKQENQKSDSIFFAKVEKDGFSLGAQRKKIKENDLPQILKKIKENSIYENKISKDNILKSEDISFNFEKYFLKRLDSKHPLIELKEVTSLITDGPHNSPPYEEIGIPMLDSKDINNAFEIVDQFATKFISEKTDIEISKRCKPQHNDLLISSRGSIGKVAIVRNGQNFNIMGNIILIRTKDELLARFLMFYLSSQKEFLNKLAHGSSQKGLYLNQIRSLKIPIPSISSQQKIITELDGYQKIVDGCRQVIDNYTPTIDIKPEWEMVTLNEIATLKYGLGKSAQNSGKHRFIRITDINELGLLKPDDKKYISIDESETDYILNKGDILMARTGATYGKCLYFESDESSVFAGYLIKISLQKKVLPKFFWIFSQSINFETQKKQLVVGGGQPQFNANTLKKLLIPIPPLQEQERIIREVIVQQEIVKGNVTLLKTFQNKIQNKLSSFGGE